MTLVIPNRYLLVAGAGDANEELNAFDRALIMSGAGNCNLVKVTSIMPPGAKLGSLAELPPGGIVYSALGTISSHESGDLISSAVSVGFSTDKLAAGVIMEGHFHSSSTEAEKRVRAMAEQALIDRNLKIDKIESISIEHRVRTAGSVIAAVLLWNN